MKLRDKIFDAFEMEEILEEIPESSIDKDTDLYSFEDPFDFYRKTKESKGYIPVTQRGLRKAFAEGITGIEFFIEMATSLRPLADEAQDVDEISRLLSQQKLTTNPNLHSVSILRNLIKEPNPEIALYAAEGLNTIENTFIEKIQRIKDRIKKEACKKYISYYLLGLLYYEFAKLLQGQRLIQVFYLKEALSAFNTANRLKKNIKRVLMTAGDVYMLMGDNDKAIRIFTHLFSEDNRNKNLLMKLAECYYNIGDYQNVITLASLAAKSSMELDEISNLIIYQWTLNL